MQHIEFQYEQRRQLALERLGSNTPFCVECTKSDWRCLELHTSNQADAGGSTPQIICRNCKAKRPPALSRRFAKGRACVICAEADLRCLEDHHIAGRKYDGMTVVVCFNCHRKLTDMQKDHPQ